MKFSARFGIPYRKMDFVNIDLIKDNQLFIDPFRIRSINTKFHQNCYSKIQDFIDMLINLSKNKNFKKLIEIIENFYERNETRLGYSIETNFGKSFGQDGGTNLIKYISKDNIFDSGFVEDIFDFLIMIPNIGEDKVSDIITTIIFEDLVKYTQEQCKLWKIAKEKVILKKLCWNSYKKTWERVETELPNYKGKPIVLVPKTFVGKNYIFSYESLYRDVIIPLYKKLELEKTDSRFVVKYKNGKVHVLGNALRKEYPCTKYVILDFIRKYDILYREYKEKMLK